MIILGIDPGTFNSAYIICDTSIPIDFGIIDNNILLGMIASNYFNEIDVVIIEDMVSYGKPVGQEVFNTCKYIGRIDMLFKCEGLIPELINRRQVKSALCSAVAKVTDAQIRQVLIDIYGPEKSIAIGLKSMPGPLYGIKKDIWQALALVVTYEKIYN